MADRNGKEHQVRHGGTLTVEGLRLRNEDGRLAVGTLAPAPGTLTLVLGPNGAGKSVWLQKLAGLRNPEGLSIRYGASSLWIDKRVGRGQRLNPDSLLQYGYAGQSPEEALFMRSMEEELAFSLRPYTHTAEGVASNAAVQALEAVGLDGTWLDRDPYRMSGGQRRRAALATLFVTPAPWLLLDEPTAGLDRNGHEKLGAHLLHLKRLGRGIVLVSHDADWALPLADRVLLLHPSGEMRSCDAAALLQHPEWMEEAGMQVPMWMRIVGDAMRAGVPAERLWDPSEAADALLAEAEVFASSLGVARNRGESVAAVDGTRRVHQSDRESRLTRFDPRAVWLSYVLLSAGLFSLASWWGLLGGAVVVLGVVYFAQIPLRRWKSVIAGFAYLGIFMACFAAIAAGVGFSGLSRHGWWDFEAFAAALFPFARTLAVLLIGLGLPLVMTPLSLRRSLEQLVSRQGKVSAFWQRIVLTVTLLIRFVPVLMAEWERFGRIFLARGKEIGRTPGVVLRRLKGTMIPLLLALFRLGDEVAVALESRGVRRDVIPTPGPRLIWHWRDSLLAAGSAVLAVMLWLWG